MANAIQDKSKAFAIRIIRCLNKLNIALKEADETEYWLDLLHETNYLDDDQYASINVDCAELIKLLTSIIKKLKESDEKK